jgi:hypothetical protein
MAKRIGEILADGGVLSAHQLEELLAHQRAHGGRFGQLLLERQTLHDPRAIEQWIAIALAVQYGFPSLPLDRFEIDHTLARLVPEAFARQHHLIPIDRIGRSMTVAMVDPLDARVVLELETLTGCIPHPVISTKAEILEAIDQLYAAPRHPPSA